MGNDFSRCSGVSFYDGVRWQDNTFDHGGNQFILRRDATYWPAVISLAAKDPLLQVCVESLATGRPIGFNQNWCLLDRADVDAEVWKSLLALDRGSAP